VLHVGLSGQLLHLLASVGWLILRVSASSFPARFFSSIANVAVLKRDRDAVQGLDQGDTVEMFSQAMGANLIFEDEKVDGNVEKWNVRKYKLQRSSRHRDLALVKDFYKDLDEFLSKRRYHGKH
jgi:RNA pol II accessory factor, Cdc73 family, C-terminal